MLKQGLTAPHAEATAHVLTLCGYPSLSMDLNGRVQLVEVKCQERSHASADVMVLGREQEERCRGFALFLFRLAHTASNQPFTTDCFPCFYPSFYSCKCVVKGLILASKDCSGNFGILVS